MAVGKACEAHARDAFLPNRVTTRYTSHNTGQHRQSNLEDGRRRGAPVKAQQARLACFHTQLAQRVMTRHMGRREIGPRGYVQKRETLKLW